MLLTTLLRLFFRPRLATRPPFGDELAELVLEPDAADDRPLGCGWFDSSHELHCGLVITEHASPDAVASALSLSDWLGLHLGCVDTSADAGIRVA